MKELDIKLHFHYDHTDQESIMARARMLKGKTLGYVYENTPYDKEKENLKNKGMAGNFIQKNWFGIPVNNSPEPDFKEAGIELKACPIINRVNKGQVTDQRTKICSINYMKLYEETWLTSHAKKKLNKILFVFHERIEDDKKWKDANILRTSLWELSKQDKLNIIQKDWTKAYEAIRHGLAHILKEEYFKVLRTSRAGSGGRNKYGILKDLVEQPVTTYSKYAKRRAFAFERNYTKQFWQEVTKPNSFESIVDSLNLSETDNYEIALINAISKYKGKTIGEIANIFDIPVPGGKAAVPTILKLAIGFKSVKSKIKEFKQLGITVKTFPVNLENMYPWQAVSFPAFKIPELTKENWDDSTLLNQLNKILFMPFSSEKSDTKVEYRKLEQPFFWSPSSEEIEMIKGEWLMYQNQASKKLIVKEIPVKSKKGFKEVITNLSKASETESIHIRPHGKDSDDRDEDNFGTSVIKQSFWLNKTLLQKLLLKSLNE